MLAGKIAGITFKLNNWFLLIVFIFIFAGFIDKFAITFFSILLHEAGHIIAAEQMGFRVKEVELLPFGGVALIERLYSAGAKKEMLIAAAGPVISLVLAAVAYYLSEINLYLFEIHDVLLYFFQTNLILAACNLIPALPLDGGRIFRACLSISFGYRQATSVVIKMSYLCSIFLLIAIIHDYVNTGIVNLTFLCAGFFIYLSAKTEAKLVSFRMMHILSQKKTHMMEQGIMPTIHFTALSNIIVHDIVRLLEPEHYYVILVIDNQCCMKGCLTETEIWEQLPQHGIDAAIGKFLSP